MDKEHILAEIRRTAAENGGVPLGSRRFAAATGINDYDWSGRHAARWSDLVREAGFEPQQLRVAFDDAAVLSCLATLTRHLGRFPTQAEIRLRRRHDPDFPSHNVFARFGPKPKLAAALLAFCEADGKFYDVAALCRQVAVGSENSEGEDEGEPEPHGFVYLGKSGRHYKIGRTNAVGRREYEIGLQMPDGYDVIHYISTDDPEGIEQYWHCRFASKRRNGEWFRLQADDVKAFKRRKFM